MVEVLHVTSGLGLGGAETMLVQLATRLQQRGHHQHVVSLNGRGALADELERNGIQVTDISSKSPVFAVRAFKALFLLRRLIKQTAPDVVQGWMYHGNLAATLAHVTTRAMSKRRLFWNLRASNMDSARYGAVIRWNARLSRLADVIIANSQVGAAFHIAQGFHTQRLEVVPNGIDTEKFRPDPVARTAMRSAYSIPSDAVLVIHVARVDPMKDHKTFLAAMNALPQLNAILVGAGTEQLTLPPNVLALGMRSDVERLYPAADIVASSSAFGEGFSNAIAEGMSSGLVPLATDVGDAKLIIGDIGSIVPAGDQNAFAAALEKIAALKPDALHKRGLEARDQILRKFSIARAVEAFERLYLSS